MRSAGQAVGATIETSEGVQMGAQEQQDAEGD